MPEEKSLKLLIVEDDAGIATMLSAFFTSHDVDTQIAPDGKQALELITTYTPDIIVLDIVLPFVDGLSVLDKLRSIPSKPLLFYSPTNQVLKKS